MPSTNASTSSARRDEMPLAGRSMELRDFQRAADAQAGDSAPLARASMVFTAGAAVRRYDWYRERPYMERLVVEEGSIRLDRLRRGAPLLNTHRSWDLEDQLGVVENPVISAGEGVCDVAFSRRESVAGYVQDVADRIVRNVSVGYVRHRIEMVPPEQEGGIWEYRVVDWEPFEVSLVPIPADMDSQIRAAGDAPHDGAAERDARTFPCEFIEVRSATPTRSASDLSADFHHRRETTMPGTTQDSSAAVSAANENDQTQQRSTPAADEAALAAARQAEQQRSADISDLCQRHGVSALAVGLIRGGNTVEQARAAVLDELARRDAVAGGHRNVRVETVTDEHETRMAGLQEALLHRVDAGSALTDNGRQYRGMSLIEIGREMIERSGGTTRGLSRLEIAGRMLQVRAAGHMGVSDFSALLSNVANRRLRAAYEQAASTYQIWARRAPNAPDFKDISVVQLSGAPELLKTNEHGEFKYGTLSDGAETYKVVTYGRIVALTRQAIINDDLRGFDRLVAAFGDSAARLENRLVYSQLTDNANMADGKPLFHADHGNLAAAGSVLDSIDKLGAGRKDMRLQKGMQGELLNISPRYLIVPAALEQVAYQYTSAQYTPVEPGKVNEFRSGGRTALEPVVEPLLDANSATAWYLAANAAQVDTVEYCYLDGAEGPVIESEMGFEVDGVSMKARLDFAAKATDFRGLRKATGAA
ncbi:Mu-like prophage major head subunit gpT family protein [Comamonas aquatica]|uniref:Mu-like prophage major head subunit gpT family protein n=1 Tax=Comamonas aquatica TaxID=225991 RepID=A0AA43AWM1_9BURK|nr:prohead protease/major capsid protein fusion protein [Comamonas aquatica]MDH1429103.1 Mu-like prophage major head subunit gpT family protein [Comamonas aquatica]MDH1604980.1 Mu-like prophage major head subunit gpT family protein [Comamonas aquatica]MDH1616004.1 Mu-like prophage major head subunit gpT family protein [Comamonas aquatica]MDH2004869.1 Mu-like prophage major head subunit gpT family protein [Comamonas aquatica]